MSKDKSKIYKDMMSDAKVHDCLMSKGKPESLEDLANVLGGVALDFGYPLSKDDLLLIIRNTTEKTNSAIEKVEKLSEADLANVAGGGPNDNDAHYVCSDTYKDKENCWFDDGCDYVNNWYPYYICKRNELDSIWQTAPYP